MSLNLLINGGFKFTILNIVTNTPITEEGGLGTIEKNLREGKFTINFKEGIIYNVNYPDVPLLNFTIEPNQGTEFRFQF